MEIITQKEAILEIPQEKGVRVIIFEDGQLVENYKLEAFHRYTIITQDHKLLDTEETKRKRYKISR
ncbi:hypothetical protein LOK74_05885 [Brevibacillus humidisoli]|uniref:hypothetical protein n=1 Tax=Brevibacillus humidisoli TaxID=2895522 RepID=UPI001E489708|nr:hypothetical protein [Brevibacillus humidisoli]UFJ42028.1 hypothetical protein LOK74_05885 [Brevibacillus humidisoli]